MSFGFLSGVKTWTTNFTTSFNTSSSFTTTFATSKSTTTTFSTSRSTTTTFSTSRSTTTTYNTSRSTQSIGGTTNGNWPSDYWTRYLYQYHQFYGRNLIGWGGSSIADWYSFTDTYRDVGGYRYYKGNYRSQAYPGTWHYYDVSRASIGSVTTTFSTSRSTTTTFNTSRSTTTTFNTSKATTTTFNTSRSTTTTFSTSRGTSRDTTFYA